MKGRLSGSLPLKMRPLFLFFAYFAGSSLFGFSVWLEVNFESPTIDQIVYHLHYSEKVAVKFGGIYLLTFLAECVGLPLAFASVVTFLQVVVFRRRQLATDDSRNAGEDQPSSFVFASHAALQRGVPIAAIAVGVTAVLLKLSFFSYIGYQFSEDHFSRHFVDPKTVELKTGKLKNLVLIYVESLEETYGSTAIFGKDLLRPIRQPGGVSFDAYRPTRGATWTIAGIVATQCGVPLRVYSERNVKKNPAQSRSFLPGATCLGDILHAHGYTNVFLGGAPLSFAGKGVFLRDHGYQEIYGRDEWESAGVARAEMGEWGIYDNALFERAKVKVKALHSSKRPFNLTLLTLDTHNPYGFLSNFCRSRGSKSFEDIVACTSEQIADFVKFLRDGGYLEDTNIVILGDHLAVSNPVFEKLKLSEDRRVFNHFISDTPPTKNTEEVLPFDLFPTITEFIGIRVVGDRLGLGYSGFFEPEAKRPQQHFQELALPSLGGSASYNSLWRPSEQ